MNEVQIVARRGETPFAEHITVTLNGEPAPPNWHHADEINRQVFYNDGTRHPAGDTVFAGTMVYGRVVITLNDDAPAEARKAYEDARRPPHIRERFS